MATEQNNTQQVLEQNASASQFAVSPTSFHTHNGIDSLKVGFKNLVFGGHSMATTWKASGNTNTINDNAVSVDSFISFMYASAPSGIWSVVCSRGKFVITSSDSESTGFAFQYIVL